MALVNSILYKWMKLVSLTSVIIHEPLWSTTWGVGKETATRQATKVLCKLRTNFIGNQNLPDMFACLGLQQYKMFRISHVIVSNITFRISLRISEKLVGFVMTICLCQGLVSAKASNQNCNCNVSGFS